MTTSTPEVEQPALTERYPDGNPKTPFGVRKPPTWFIPKTSMFVVGLAHLHGALKYGHFNWREDPITTSTYIDAAIRHISAWCEGEETANDSGIHHLGHAIACLNILIDAQIHNTLHDDRHPITTDFDKLFEDLEPTIHQLYERWGPK